MTVTIDPRDMASTGNAYGAIIAGETNRLAKLQGFDRHWQLLETLSPATYQTVFSQIMWDKGDTVAVSRTIVTYGSFIAGYIHTLTISKARTLVLQIQEALGSDTLPVIGYQAFIARIQVASNGNSATIAATGVRQGVPQGAIVRVGFLDGSWSWTGTQADPTEADLVNPDNWTRNVTAVKQEPTFSPAEEEEEIVLPAAKEKRSWRSLWLVKKAV